MKKRFVLILLALAVFFSVSFSASADAPLITDNAYLLTEQECLSLEAVFADVREEYGFTPYLYTTDSFDGMDAEEYAGFVYDEMGCDFDGMLLLVSLEEGYWYVLTNGECAYALDDWDTDAIGETVVEYLRDGDYYDAFQTFALESAEHMENAADTVDEESETKGIGATQILIALGIGVVIALIVVLIMTSGMKTVRRNHTANYYVRSGSLDITYSRDIFLYSTVSRVRKQSNSSGGSRSGGSRGGSGGRI